MVYGSEGPSWDSQGQNQHTRWKPRGRGSSEWVPVEGSRSMFSHLVLLSDTLKDFFFAPATELSGVWKAHQDLPSNMKAGLIHGLESGSWHLTSWSLPDPPLTVTLGKALMLHGPPVSVYGVGMSPFKTNCKGQLIMSDAYIMHTYAYIKQEVFTGFTITLYCSNLGHTLYARNVQFPTKSSVILV